MSSGYLTRYAPSPTGPMHLGHARTHLVAYLRARASRGRVAMRVDDLDTPRVRAGSFDDFARAHEWLGLEFDDGPVFQSDRVDRYGEALARLERSGHLYACDCSRRRIESASPGPAGDSGLRYPNWCRRREVDRARRHALRFRLEEPSPGFTDALFGVRDPGAVRGDFVVRRADGVVAYHLASVVDDLDMGVTEVVRGADLLASTSRQIALIDALGAAPPDHLHVPLVLGADGARLGKRHGSAGVLSLREAGWTAERLVGRLAWSLGLTDSPAPARASELVERFDPDAIPREAWRDRDPGA